MNSGEYMYLLKWKANELKETIDVDGLTRF